MPEAKELEDIKRDFMMKEEGPKTSEKPKNIECLIKDVNILYDLACKLIKEKEQLEAYTIDSPRILRNENDEDEPCSFIFEFEYMPKRVDASKWIHKKFITKWVEVKE